MQSFQPVPNGSPASGDGRANRVMRPTPNYPVTGASCLGYINEQIRDVHDRITREFHHYERRMTSVEAETVL